MNGARLTARVLPTLDVPPTLGRFFTKQEDDSHAPVAVISYGLWLNRFHRDPHVAGATITLDLRNYRIIGVMPRDFEFPLLPGRVGQAQLWVPMSFSADELSPSAGSWGTHLVARLKDGVTVQQAVDDANRVAQQVMRDFPPELAAIHIRGDVLPLRESIVAGVRPLLRTLFLAVCIVLLIACANVAILLVVRAIRRRREHAVHLALGARAGTILRECVSEGLVLSLAGGDYPLICSPSIIRHSLAWMAGPAVAAKLRLSAGKKQPPTLSIPASRSYRRVQLAVNGNEVTTLPLPSTNVAVPSIDSSFRDGLRVIGPTKCQRPRKLPLGSQDIW